MATLALKEMGKFLWEGREKGGLDILRYFFPHNSLMGPDGGIG